MKKILADIQNGTFAREFIEENEKGCPNFNRLREQEKTLQVEKVGAELRAMMAWLKPGQQKPEPQPEPAAARK